MNNGIRTRMLNVIDAMPQMRTWHTLAAARGLILRSDDPVAALLHAISVMAREHDDLQRIATEALVAQPLPPIVVRPAPAAEWLPRPNADGFWWLRDGDREPEVVRVTRHPWEGDAFEFVCTNSETEVHSREIGERNPVLWQRVAPPTEVR